MARLTRVAPIGIPQHIIQRGNNRQVCFGGVKNGVSSNNPAIMSNPSMTRPLRLEKTNEIKE